MEKDAEPKLPLAPLCYPHPHATSDQRTAATAAVRDTASEQQWRNRRKKKHRHTIVIIMDRLENGESWKHFAIDVVVLYRWGREWPRKHVVYNVPSLVTDSWKFYFAPNAKIGTNVHVHVYAQRASYIVIVTHVSQQPINFPFVGIQGEFVTLFHTTHTHLIHTHTHTFAHVIGNEEKSRKRINTTDQSHVRMRKHENISYNTARHTHTLLAYIIALEILKRRKQNEKWATPRKIILYKHQTRVVSNVCHTTHTHIAYNSKANKNGTSSNP